MDERVADRDRGAASARRAEAEAAAIFDDKQPSMADVLHDVITALEGMDDQGRERVLGAALLMLGSGLRVMGPPAKRVRKAKGGAS